MSLDPLFYKLKALALLNRIKGLRTQLTRSQMSDMHSLELEIRLEMVEKLKAMFSLAHDKLEELDYDEIGSKTREDFDEVLVDLLTDLHREIGRRHEQTPVLPESKLQEFIEGCTEFASSPMPVSVPQPEPHSVGGALVHMPHVCSIMTATVEIVSEQLDLASILHTDWATARILSDADVGSANVRVTRASVMGENGAKGGAACGGGENASGSEEDEEEEDSDDFWHTSVGKFKFALDTLPQPLQYIHQLLTKIPTIKKPEILYYVLQCLNTMALHGDFLAKAAREQRGFFIWCQENLLIKNLGELCNAEHSHICQVGVPLLLHYITLPCLTKMLLQALVLQRGRMFGHALPK